MGDEPIESVDESLPVQRLGELLRRLGEMGVNQSQVAQRTGIPRQYLNDVIHRRRPLTELLSRRLAEEFDFDHQWLLGSKDSLERVVLSAPRSSTERVWLPIVGQAIIGDPREHPTWSGACMEICGTAAARAGRADLPYVLQLGHGDRENRLRKGDFVLVSQAAAENAEVSTVRCKEEILLARSRAAKWLRVETGEPMRGECEVTGHLIGVVWSALI
jgi:plasmid maintenance system antidote protein VapI